jgi:hypothetical protein
MASDRNAIVIPDVTMENIKIMSKAADAILNNLTRMNDSMERYEYILDIDQLGRMLENKPIVEELAVTLDTYVKKKSKHKTLTKP